MSGVSGWSFEAYEERVGVGPGGVVDRRWLQVLAASTGGHAALRDLWRRLDETSPWSASRPAEPHDMVDAVLEALARQGLGLLSTRPPSRVDTNHLGEGGGEVAAPPRSERPIEDTWFEVRVVDELGQPIDNIALSLEAGGTHGLVTDGSGVARLDGVRAQQGYLTLDDLDALRDAVRPRWDVPREGEWLTDTLDHSYFELHGRRAIELALLSERPHTIVIQPWVIRARLIGLYFDTNKCFLLPSALASIKQIKGLYDEEPESALLVVGHTDTSGDPSYNDPLSLERAEATAAYLQDDVDAWLGWYGQDTPWEKRWGAREDGLMFDSLPDAEALEASGNPITAYQQARGLSVDGWVGPETRRQLIADYMAHDETTLPTEATITAHGCGESFPLPAADLPLIEQAIGIADDQAHRRVEIVFFDRGLGVQPPPSGTISPPGSTAYPEWMKRSLRTHDFSLGGTLRIRLFDHDARPMPGVDFVVDFGSEERRGVSNGSGDAVLQGRIPSVASCVVRYHRLEVRDEDEDDPLVYEFEQTVYLDADSSLNGDASRSRLLNLGYDLEAGLEDCVRRFESRHGLPDTGDPDEPTTALRLMQVHREREPATRDDDMVEYGGPPHD